MSALKIARSSLLPRFAVSRPITTIMVYVAILVVSAVAYTRLPLELLPAGFSAPFLSLRIPYPNSTPEEVEQSIARPVEGILGTVSGIRSLSSTSNASGCFVFVRFAQDTDMDVAYANVRDRADRVISELPTDVERIFVRKFSDSDDPILWAALEIPVAIADPYQLLDKIVVRALQRIDGVANVELFGVPQRSVQVQIQQERVRAHKIDMVSLLQRLSRDNFSLPSGYVLEGGNKLYVRSIGRYQSAEQVAAIQINKEGVDLGDIATVEYTEPERRSITRIDGRKGAMIAVYKESTANGVAVGDAAKAALEEVFAQTPALSGTSFEPLFDQAALIRDSIDQLQSSLGWGALFALGTLFFFLRRVRMTLVVTLAIPFSLLVSVATLYFIGWSLNIITMMGLMICVGLVVDNSIVVIENIYRRSQEGDSPELAAERGGSEVALAITIATLTTVVVFVPLILMNDDVGFSFYMLRLGVPTIVGILASLIIALTLIPLLTLRLTRARSAVESASISAASHAYRRAAIWVLSHRLDATILLLLVSASMVIPASNLAFSDEAQGNINNIQIQFDLPQNLTLDEVALLTADIEAHLNTHRDEWDIRTITSRISAGSARVEIFLRPAPRTSWWQYAAHEFTERYLGYPAGKPTRAEVMEQLPNAIPDYPGTRWQIEGGNEEDSTDQTVVVVLYGDDTSSLVQLASQAEARLRAVPGVLSVRSALERGKDYLRVVVDRQLAEQAGVSAQLAARTVNYALRGVELPEMRLGEREVDIHVQASKEDRRNLQQLRDLRVTTSDGGEIPLAAVARFQVARNLGSIHRRDGKTSLSVRVVTSDRDLGAVYNAIDSTMNALPLPEGTSWDKGERFSQMQQSSQAQLFGLLLAITFVFILMGMLFESFLLPFSIILTLPLALVGVYWTLYLTGTPSDLFAGIGMIVLIGIVVNNAIVLVDLANRYQGEGMSREEALVAAVDHRFRPIAMTALTTIFGLVPIAVGNVYMIGIPYAGLGRGMIGGLLVHTLLSPLVVPLLYTLLDDVRRVGRHAARLLVAP
ncbi:MAG: efflux RND transporter permease subunit [Acidobacteriota bacterium]